MVSAIQTKPSTWALFRGSFLPIFLFNSTTNTNIANFNHTNCSVCLSRDLNWLMLVNLSIFVGVGRLRALPYYFKVPFSGNVIDESCLTFLFLFNSSLKLSYFNTNFLLIDFWIRPSRHDGKLPDIFHRNFCLLIKV